MQLEYGHETLLNYLQYEHVVSDIVKCVDENIRILQQFKIYE